MADAHAGQALARWAIDIAWKFVRYRPAELSYIHEITAVKAAIEDPRFLALIEEKLHGGS